MIVVDTNVLSELMLPRRDPSVDAWLDAQRPARLVTTAISLAEILYGVERLPAGRRRDRLVGAARDVFGAFADRILPFDIAAAAAFATVVAEREAMGRPIGTADAQIAAICRVRGASLATRNVRDFADVGLELIDPWA